MLKFVNEIGSSLLIGAIILPHGFELQVPCTEYKFYSQIEGIF